MRLVFFGTPDFAIPSLLSLHKSKHEILAVVTAPDKKAGRGLAMQSSIIKQKSIDLGYPFYQPKNLNNPDFITSMKNKDADIYVVVAFKRLSESLFNIPKNGAINLHASLLPKYRGAAPIHHSILNGDIETGVTTFKIEKSIDTGKILLQRKYKIKENITTGEVYIDLANIGAQLIIETLDGIDDNLLIPIEQDFQHMTKAPKILSTSARIDWSKPVENIHNHIRAFSPTPGAYTFYNKKRIKVFSSLINFQEKKISVPGKVHCKDDYISVGTGDGVIDIYEMQIEGKKRMSIKNVINGISDLNGAIFE